jgi:hypothetical protein
MRRGLWLGLSIAGIALLVVIVAAGIAFQDRSLLPLANLACPGLPPGDLVLSPEADDALVVTAAPANLSWDALGVQLSHRAPESYPWELGAWQLTATKNASDLGLRGPVRLGDAVRSQGVRAPMVEMYAAGFLVGGSARLDARADVAGANVTLVASNPTNASVALPRGSLAVGAYRVASAELVRPVGTTVQTLPDATLAPGATRALSSWTAPGPGSYVLGVGTMDDAFTVCKVLRVDVAG